jgi:hypothetical protein
MKTLCLLLLSACACLGQAWTFLDPAFVCQTNVVTGGGTGGTPFSPTNVPGFPAVTWFVSDDLYTNGGRQVLPDRSINHYNLTTEVNDYCSIGTLGSVKTILCSTIGSLYNNTTFPTVPQPLEVDMLFKCTEVGTGDKYYFSSAGGPVFLMSGGGTYIYAGQNLSFNSVVTGIWCMYSTVFSNSSSKIYTNKVQGVSGNAGTGSLSAFGIPQVGGSSGHANFEFLEAVIWSTNLDVTTRASLYNYWYTNYPTASLPAP